MSSPHPSDISIMVLSLIASGILAPFAFLLGRRSRQIPTRVPILATVLFAALIALKALFHFHPAYEAAIFPLPIFAPFKNALIFILALLVLGLLLQRISTPRTRSLIYLAALLIFAANLLITYRQFNLSTASPITANASHHCPQSTPQTCVPAACVSALSYINLTTTESAMTQHCLTTSRGTTDYNIYCGLASALQSAHALYRAGMCECPPSQLARPGTLAVISVDSHSHAICTLGAGNSIIVQDPLLPAPQIWSLSQLAAAYSGVATVITPY